MSRRRVRPSIYSPGSDEIGADGPWWAWCADSSGRRLKRPDASWRVRLGPQREQASPARVRRWRRSTSFGQWEPAACELRRMWRERALASLARASRHLRRSVRASQIGQPSSTFSANNTIRPGNVSNSIISSTLVGEFRFSRWCVGVSEKDLQYSRLRSASEVLLFPPT